jgi:hypothetical protein
MGPFGNLVAAQGSTIRSWVLRIRERGGRGGGKGWIERCCKGDDGKTVAMLPISVASMAL